MKLLTIDATSGPRAGVVVDDDVLDLEAAFAHWGMIPWAPVDVGAVLALGDEGLAHISRVLVKLAEADAAQRALLVDRGILRPLDQVRLRTPILKPGLIMLAGRSYHSHIDEMVRKYKLANSITPEEPNAFTQSPNSLAASGDAIRIPGGVEMLDYEAELAVVFGRRCHQLNESEVMATVAGFVLMNDVSARDWNASARRPDGTTDFTKIRLGKQFPTFCPVGPWVTTIDEFADIDDIGFTCAVNGEIVQQGHTSDLVFSVVETIAHYARWHVFEPGDIFSMGTPAGVGVASEPSRFLGDGDVIEISSPLLGTLRNVVATAPGG
ncbi:fumarylacetoacetate hydrolase family protein [Sphingobium chungangianum]